MKNKSSLTPTGLSIRLGADWCSHQKRRNPSNASKAGLPFALLKEVVTADGKRLATGATVNVGERGGREY